MRATLFALTLAAPLWASPVMGPPRPAAPRAAVKGVTAPETVTVRPGRLAKVEATSAAPGLVRWVNVHDALDLIESETGRWVIVSSPTPGRYRIACYSDAGGPPSYVIVVVEGPAPPKPPEPDATPPAPDAALVASLSAAYAKDADADKATLKAKLAALYRQGAMIAEHRKAESWGAWRDAMSTAAKVTGVAGTLPATQAAVSDWLRSRVPNVAAKPLGDEPAAVAALRAVALALEAVR